MERHCVNYNVAPNGAKKMMMLYTGAIAPAYKDSNPNGFNKRQFDFRNQLFLRLYKITSSVVQCARTKQSRFFVWTASFLLSLTRLILEA